MFRPFPDLIASLERMHGVALTYKFCRSREGEAGVDIHVSTNGDLPDILSAQWEIEKVRFQISSNYIVLRHMPYRL